MILVAVLLLLPAPGLAASDVFRIGVSSAEIGWDEPPDGLVDGYLVLLSRNGEPEELAAVVEEPHYTIEAEYGDNVVAKIRTLGRLPESPVARTSASSAPSPRIHFWPGRTWESDGLLTLHCAECDALEVRDIKNDTIPEVVPGHGDPWKVVGIGDLHAAPGLEVVWHDPTTGAVEVVGLGGDVDAPLAVQHAALGNRVPLGLVDSDGDGVPEVVARDPGTGSIEFWKLLFGSWLVRVSVIGAPPDYELLSGEDFDGDGTGDLWWRKPNDQIEIWKLRDRMYAGTLIQLSNPGAGEPAHVGDFDGDDTPDALWRDPSGALEITHLGPGASPVEQEIAWLPEDDLREVRAVANFDGEPGVEILLQHQEKLTVDIIHPVRGLWQRDRLIDMTEPWKLVDARND